MERKKRKQWVSSSSQPVQEVVEGAGASSLGLSGICIAIRLNSFKLKLPVGIWTKLGVYLTWLPLASCMLAFLVCIPELFLCSLSKHLPSSDTMSLKVDVDALENSHGATYVRKKAGKLTGDNQQKEQGYSLLLWLRHSHFWGRQKNHTCCDECITVADRLVCNCKELHIATD